MQVDPSAPRTALAATMVLAFALAPGICAAEEGAQSGPAAGAGLSSAQEKAQFRERMDGATTLDQCKAIFADHMKLADQRAAEKTAKMKNQMAAGGGGQNSCMKGSKGGDSGGGGCCKGMGQNTGQDGGGGHDGHSGHGGGHGG